MPRVCATDGCPELAVRRGRCQDHVRAFERAAARRNPSRASYGSARWRRVRRLAVERDGHRCVLCGSGDHPHVDHIDGQGLDGPHAFELSNLRTLCRSCHSRHTALTTGFGRTRS